MSTFKSRNAAQKNGRFYSVKTSFKKILAHEEGLATQTEEAVQPILTEGSLLANLHVLRCLSADSGQSIPDIDQTFYNNCYAAVTYYTGNHAQEFDPTKHPSLAASYAMDTQSLPPGHAKPERPTFIKDLMHCHLMHCLRNTQLGMYCRKGVSNASVPMIDFGTSRHYNQAAWWGP